MNLYELERRGTDSWGSGHYGASRGSRGHRGIDLACTPETPILSPVEGKITKIGWVYLDPKKNRLRYVQVTCGIYNHRIMYMNPLADLGEQVDTNTVIGTSQSLQEFYQGITDHIHYEIKQESNGSYIDPTPALDLARYACGPA